MKTHSLTRMLTFGVLLANLICSVTFSVVATVHEMHGRRRAFDIMLRGRVDSLMGAFRNDAFVGNPPALELSQPSDAIYEVIAPSGNIVMSSPHMTLGLAAAMAGQPSADYFDFSQAGRTYRALRLQRRSADRETLTFVYAASTEDLRHEAVEAAGFYARSSAAVLLIVTLLVIWFLRLKLSPLKELAIRAASVSADSWEFEPPSGALRTRELRPIATSIQKLLQELKLAFERQRRFTGDAAHELKTSIAVLKSSLQLLAMKPRNADEYQAGISGVSSDIRRMEELTEQMLTLARLETEEVVQHQHTDLNQVVRSVTTRMHAFARVRGITILTVLNDAPHRIVVQPRDADVLCSNLVMNALQHSPANSKLTVSVGCSESSIELHVEDQGVGIPSEALPRLFDRFYRVDASRSRQSGGTGLGLAICKAIVDRSHGTVHIESTSGSGTRVSVAFPRVL